MRENHSVAVEPEPVSVQVVKWFGLVPFSFQFITRLAAVFSEEGGDFGILVFNCIIQRRSIIPILHIDIRTF